MLVKLGRKDIERIRQAGFIDDYFVDEKNMMPCLKRINGYCIFLDIKEGKAHCRIYPFRPRRCAGYPGKDTCDLIRHYVVNSRNDV